MTTISLADYRRDLQADTTRRLLYLAADNGSGFEEVRTDSTSRLKAFAALIAAHRNLPVNRTVGDDK